MKSVHVVVIGAGLLWGTRAHAEPCRIVAAPELPAVWQRAAAALQDCAGATIRVEPQRVTVIASDGRAAHRSVATPRELSAVVAGVVASIPVINPPPPPAASPEENVDAPPPATITVWEQLPPIAPPPRESSATIGATFGTRVGLPTGVLTTELELRGDIRLDRWIFSLSGRVAPSGTRVSGRGASEWEYTELGVGALGGRWFALGGGVLTTEIGPRFGMISRETESATNNRKDLWIELAARYVLPIGDRWRPAISSEVEGAATRLLAQGANRSDFPSWSASLRVGIVGSFP